MLRKDGWIENQKEVLKIDSSLLDFVVIFLNNNLQSLIVVYLRCVLCLK